MNKRDNLRNTLKLIGVVSLWLFLILVFPFGNALMSLNQAQLAQKQGDLIKAAELLEKASHTLFWRREELVEQAGDLALRAEQPHRVIDFLAPLQAQEKLSRAAQYNLAEAYARTGQLLEATSLRENLVQGGYRCLDIYPKLLEVYFRENQFEKAQSALKELVKLQPEYVLWYYQLGIVQAALNPSESIQSLRYAAEHDEEIRKKVMILLSQLELGQNQDEKAVQYVYSGRGLAGVNEWALAEAAFNNAVQIRPDYAEAWAYLGLAKQSNFILDSLSASEKRDTESVPSEEKELEDKIKLEAQDGLKEIQHALELNPNSQVALAFLSSYWQQHGDISLAMEFAERAVELYPRDLNVLNQYAEALVQNGELEKALQVYLRAVEIVEDKLAARKALVSFCVQNSYKLDEIALPEARRFVYQNPGDVECLDLLAQVLIGLNYTERAFQLLEQALRLNPQYAPAHLHKGMIYFLQGNTLQAKEELNLVLELAPYTTVGESAKRLLESYIP